MVTLPVTRAEREQLRALAGTAHGRELARELTRLDAAFGAWRGGRLSPHELAARVRRFHDGSARDLDALYARMDPAATVARAVALGVLATADVPAALLAKLAPAIEFYASPGG
jgi:hypothetical protein